MELETWEIDKLLLETSFPFLAAREGYWIDGDLNETSFYEMSPKHITSAYNYLKCYESSLNRHLRENLKQVIEKKSKDKRSKYLSNLDDILDYCDELYDEKLSEMEKVAKQIRIK